jgi:hypothetical protein
MRPSKRRVKGATRRRVTLVGVLSVLIAVCSFGGSGALAFASSGATGKPIALGVITTPSTARAHFHHVRPAPTFSLVLTAPAKSQVNVTWTVVCYDPARKSSGGATGQATITNGHWSKLVRANWVMHPAYCSGSVVGLDESTSPDSSMLHIHVFAG